LRGIDGFAQALAEEYAASFDETGKRYLQRVRESAQRMAHLIDDLLALSRVTRAVVSPEKVDLGAIAQQTIARLQRAEPQRTVTVTIPTGLDDHGDARLLGIAFDNLLSNAWKFTAHAAAPEISVGALHSDNEGTVYFVRDNGVGFDMTYADKLFGTFQRLHSPGEFSGMGIGLASSQRIISRHGGRIWAEGAVGKGATFFFTLPPPLRQPSPDESGAAAQKHRSQP
jgi:light-regulated signal transduction histidine kinase (bacteriophytochrome)